MEAGEIIDGKIVAEGEEPEVAEEIENLEGDGEIEDEHPEGEEPWMQSEGGSGPHVDKVPFPVFEAQRHKLRAKVSERDSEIERLRLENEQLKSQKVAPASAVAIPKRSDYDDEDEYFSAIDDYQNKRLQETLDRRDFQKNQETTQREHQTAIQSEVDRHYERAAELVSKTGIKPDVYKQTDAIVRQAVERVTPEKGDAIVDHLISTLGEGSEKVMFYLGRNKNALEVLAGKLSTDPTGLTAAIYLGEQKSRLAGNSGKQPSSAPAPGSHARGDKAANANIAVLKRKYKEAHKKGNAQTAYDIRQQAKKAGADVDAW